MGIAAGQQASCLIALNLLSLITSLSFAFPPPPEAKSAVRMLPPLTPWQSCMHNLICLYLYCNAQRPVSCSVQASEHPKKASTPFSFNEGS